MRGEFTLQQLWEDEALTMLNVPGLGALGTLLVRCTLVEQSRLQVPHARKISFCIRATNRAQEPEEVVVHHHIACDGV